MNFKVKLISIILVCSLSFTISVNAEIYSSTELTSSGLSEYIHFMDSSTPNWTRGVELQIFQGITVNMFGSGILDFH